MYWLREPVIIGSFLAEVVVSFGWKLDLKFTVRIKVGTTNLRLNKPINHLCIKKVALRHEVYTILNIIDIILNSLIPDINRF